MKLEDDIAGEKAFITCSLPFEITLSIDPGESICVYYAKEGFPVPKAGGDFYLADWTPFVAKNLDTGQIVPLGPLPTLLQGRINNWGVALTIFGTAGLFFYLLIGISDRSEGQTWLLTSLSILVLGLIFLASKLSAKKKYLRDLNSAKIFAKSCTV